MRSAIQRTAALLPDATPIDVEAIEQRHVARSTPMPGIADVWRDTWVTFVAHAPGILLLSVFGFAGASLLGLAVSRALNLDAYVHVSGPFATPEGIRHIFAPDDVRLFVVLAVQAVLGWPLTSFARGAITHLALNAGSFGQACSCALRRLPALLVGTLLYSAVIGFGAVGINVGLRDGSFDLSNVGQ